jgi:pimeloyl-ACP methyl ester carboxylesterase
MARRLRGGTSFLTIVALVLGACGAASPSPVPATPTAPAVASPSPALPGSAAPSPVSASAGPTALTWTPTDGSDVQRAELSVPLDYGNPAAGTISLSIARRLADDQAHRLGVLFVNPGGPGAPGVGIAGAFGLATAIPQAVLDRFDVISWDPRGVGESQGLACPEPATITSIESLEPDPTGEQALHDYQTAFDAVAAQCQAAGAAILPYLGEANTARDMDAIRAALGETRVSYLGWSYGTYLGYLYAVLFPGHLRAAVLDGPVDPTLDLIGRDLGQGQGFDRAFGNFLDLCAAASACPFHGGGDPAKAYDALIARLDRTPIAGLGAGQAVYGVLAWLYGRDYGGLATALDRAEAGDGRMLRSAADGFFDGVSMGSYEATVCLDVAHATTTDAIATAVRSARQAAPRFGPVVMVTDQYGCLDWPVSAAPVSATGPPTGLPPILVVAGRWDPATPPEGGQALAKALGTGVVLTRDGLGHTSGSSATTDGCLRDALVSYLVDLRTPPAGTICTDGPAFTWP